MIERDDKILVSTITKDDLTSYGFITKHVDTSICLDGAACEGCIFAGSAPYGKCALSVVEKASDTKINIVVASCRREGYVVTSGNMENSSLIIKNKIEEIDVIRGMELIHI